MTDPLQRLQHAVAATRHAGGAFASRQRSAVPGLDGFEEIARGLSQSQVDEVKRDADELADDDVNAVLLGEASSPPSLAASRAAPPVLFIRGSQELLRSRG